MRNKETVKHCQFQIEFSRNYYLGILQTNEENERRIERLTRDLERERSINIKLQGE